MAYLLLLLARHRRNVQLRGQVARVLNGVAVTVRVVPRIVTSAVVVQRCLAIRNDHLLVVVMRKVNLLVGSVKISCLVAVRLLVRNVIQVCVT